MQFDVAVAEVDGHALDGVVLLDASAHAVDLEIDGVRRTFALRTVGSTTWVDSALGTTALVEVERYPEPGSGLAEGALVAPMPGTVVRVDVAEGDAVTAGQVLVVLEAMKMEHAVRAPLDGVVEQVAVAAGQQVESETLLAVVAPGEVAS